MPDPLESFPNIFRWSTSSTSNVEFFFRLLRRRRRIKKQQNKRGISKKIGSGEGQKTRNMSSMQIKRIRHFAVKTRRVNLPTREEIETGDLRLSEVALKNWSRAQSSLARFLCSLSCWTNSIESERNEEQKSCAYWSSKKPRSRVVLEGT